MDYRYPHYLWVDNDWIRASLTRMFAELETYLAKWARFVELKGE
jgi:hypothetical protein